jgi:hypothetical protein
MAEAGAQGSRPGGATASAAVCARRTVAGGTGVGSVRLEGGGCRHKLRGAQLPPCLPMLRFAERHSVALGLLHGDGACRENGVDVRAALG